MVPQGNIVPGVYLNATVPQGNMMSAYQNHGSVIRPQLYLPQIQYFNPSYNASYDIPADSLNQKFNNASHTYNLVPYHSQQPAPLLSAPVIPNLCSVKNPSLSSSTLLIILTLSETRDWTTWNNAVVNAVRTISGLGHLFEGPSNDPLLQPVYPPLLPDPMKGNLTLNGEASRLRY